MPNFLRSTENQIIVMMFISTVVICTVILHENYSQAFIDSATSNVTDCEEALELISKQGTNDCIGTTRARNRRQSYYTFKKMAQEEDRSRRRNARIQTRKRKNSDYRSVFLPQNTQQQRSPTLGPSFLRRTKNKIVLILFIAIVLI
ncbi:hypothetical protein XENTR_v10015072 [Xenopus tropicalis]|nr:hypothetical protein XENTR_v10015072 [Xenopus tropicalis]